MDHEYPRRLSIDKRTGYATIKQRNFKRGERLMVDVVSKSGKIDKKGIEAESSANNSTKRVREITSKRRRASAEAEVVFSKEQYHVR